MKLLYISSLLNSNGTGGGHVSASNYKLIQHLDNISEILLVDCSGLINVNTLLRQLYIFMRSVLGYSSSLGFWKCRAVLKSEELKLSDVIWLDGSFYGPLVTKIKKKYPEKKVITFFHNVEFDFYREIFRGRSFLYKVLIKSAFSNEKKSLVNSDTLVTMTTTDANRLKKVYGISCHYVQPAFFESKVSETEIIQMTKPGTDYILFIGSDFPPNIEALEYLVKKIMPFLPRKKLMAVGRGLGKYRSKFESENVIIQDFVYDLSELYINSSVVVAPIFSGSGMKVKIAEALMYGKHIIGTDFSFIGYRRGLKTDEFLITANEADEYKYLLSLNYKSFSSGSLKYFDENYSLVAQLKNIKKIFNFTA